MTEIERKAQALANEVRLERGWDAHTIFSRHNDTTCEALCRAIEQHEAFRQEVSDAMQRVADGQAYPSLLLPFIIPKPKPDPLVDAMAELAYIEPKLSAEKLRAALEARGLEIREKGQ